MEKIIKNINAVVYLSTTFILLFSLLVHADVKVGDIPYDKVGQTADYTMINISDYR